jgi:hypothetical protein
MIEHHHGDLDLLLANKPYVHGEEATLRDVLFLPDVGSQEVDASLRNDRFEVLL